MPELIEENEVDELTFIQEAPIKKRRHYIDDDHLTKILSEWKHIYDADVAAGKQSPRLPEAVGEAILDMSEAMGKRYNFARYSYLDEMKDDAVHHCVKYIHNFNPNKLSEKKGKVSAFGYINMIIWRSFTRRIKYEKQQQYLKYKSFELMGGLDAFQDEDLLSIQGDDGGVVNISISSLGADFIQKAKEYEEENGLDKVVKKEKKVEFDDFMFNMDVTDVDIEDDPINELEFD